MWGSGPGLCGKGLTCHLGGVTRALTCLQERSLLGAWRVRRDGYGEGGTAAQNLREAWVSSREGEGQGARSWTGHLYWPRQVVSGDDKIHGPGVKQLWGVCPGQGGPPGRGAQTWNLGIEGREQVANAAGTVSQGAGGFQQLRGV